MSATERTVRCSGSGKLVAGGYFSCDCPVCGQQVTLTTPGATFTRIVDHDVDNRRER